MSILDGMKYVAPDGTRTILRFGDDGVTHLRNEVDIETLLDHNARYRTLIGKGIGKDKTAWRPVAKLDMVTYQKLINEGIISVDDHIDQKRFRAWLNDRENYKFRTSEGKV
jgi:hypothetical protein